MKKFGQNSGEFEIVRGHIANTDPTTLIEGNPNYFHNLGKAVDLRMRDFDLNEVAERFLTQMNDKIPQKTHGAVGLYIGRNFAHLDLGERKIWTT